MCVTSENITLVESVFLWNARAIDIQAQKHEHECSSC